MGRYRNRRGNPKYPATANNDGARVTMHRWRAEQALRKPLPHGAVVHHVIPARKDAVCPLVICQDAAYHALLHARMRVRDAGGNPNTDKICDTCGCFKRIELFYRKRSVFQGRSGTCKVCEYAKQRERRARHVKQI